MTISNPLLRAINNELIDQMVEMDASGKETAFVPLPIAIAFIDALMLDPTANGIFIEKYLDSKAANRFSSMQVDVIAGLAGIRDYLCQ